MPAQDVVTHGAAKTQGQRELPESEQTALDEPHVHVPHGIPRHDLFHRVTAVETNVRRVARKLALSAYRAPAQEVGGGAVVCCTNRGQSIPAWNIGREIEMLVGNPRSAHSTYPSVLTCNHKRDLMREISGQTCVVRGNAEGGGRLLDKVHSFGQSLKHPLQLDVPGPSGKCVAFLSRTW